MTAKPTPPRVSISISSGDRGDTISPAAIKALATQRNKQEVLDLADQELAPKSQELSDYNKAVKSLIVEAITDLADGKGSSGYALSNAPEARFTTANRKPRTDKKGVALERNSQANALRGWLGIEKDKPIVLSESDLVAAAIRAAREQKSRGQNYSTHDLIREGIAMIAQTLISKRIAEINALGDAPDNLPGAADAFYLDHLEKLRSLRADPEKWFSTDRKVNPYGRRRGDKITVNILARACQTNDNQIRTFLKRHGITDVYDPKDASEED
jgi:hypothetical protein